MPPTTDASRAPSLRSSFQSRALWTGIDHGSIMGMELMAAILTWTGVGWLADRWLGTGPWLLVAGGLLGNFAGLYLIWIRSERMNAAEARNLEEARRAAR